MKLNTYVFLILGSGILIYTARANDSLSNEAKTKIKKDGLTTGHTKAEQKNVATNFTKQDYIFTTKWSHTELPQWQLLISEFKNKSVNILEVGVYEGSTAVWMLENLLHDPKSQYVAVDPFKWIQHKSGINAAGVRLIEQRFRSNTMKTGKWNQVTIMKGNSYDQLIKLNFETSNPVKFDLIYIDGSHTAHDVLADAVLAWRLLKPNGILIFDDYVYRRIKKPYRNPKIAIDSFVACHKFEIEVIQVNWQMAIRKVSKPARKRTLTNLKKKKVSKIFRNLQ